jgi:chromosome segregation ATPase
MTYKSLHTTQAIPASLVMAALLLTPFVSSAQVLDRSGDTRFCSSLDSIETKIIDTLSDRLDTAKARYTTHLDTLATKRDAALAQLETKRSEVDVKWEQTLTQLKAKAKTDAQTAAIAEYEAAVESLVEARRASVDVAVDTFVAGVSDLRSTIGTDYSAMLATHKAEMEAAFDEAQAACDAGTASATVREQLRANLSTIRETFKQERIEYVKRDEFVALRQARLAATEQARQTFRTGLEAANAKLRAALGSRN